MIVTLTLTLKDKKNLKIMKNLYRNLSREVTLEKMVV